MTKQANSPGDVDEQIDCCQADSCTSASPTPPLIRWTLASPPPLVSFRLTERAHAAVRAVLSLGEIAIDATAGNGHDTRVLAAAVGPSGRVFAFDVQSEAIARTAEALGPAHPVTLLHMSHAEMRAAVPLEYHGRIAAVMFNLGYRPGGDRRIATSAESTLEAIAAALDLLRPGGVLTVLAYPGHSGGAEEAAAVAKALASFEPVVEHGVQAGHASPLLFVVRRR